MPVELVERIIKTLLDEYDDICDPGYTLDSTRKAIQTLCLVHHRLKRVLYSSFWRQMCVSLQMQHRALISGCLPSLLWVARNLPESLPYLSIYQSPYIDRLPRCTYFPRARPLMLNLNTRRLVYIDIGMINLTCRADQWHNTTLENRKTLFRLARRIIERDIANTPDLVGRCAIHVRFSIQNRLSDLQQDLTRTRPVERLIFSQTFRLLALGKLRLLQEGGHMCIHFPFNGLWYSNVVEHGPGRVVGSKFVHKTRSYNGPVMMRRGRYQCDMR